MPTTNKSSASTLACGGRCCCCCWQRGGGLVIDTPIIASAIALGRNRRYAADFNRLDPTSNEVQRPREGIDRRVCPSRQGRSRTTCWSPSRLSFFRAWVSCCPLIPLLVIIVHCLRSGWRKGAGCGPNLTTTPVTDQPLSTSRPKPQMIQWERTRRVGV